MHTNLFPDYDQIQIRRCQSLETYLQCHGFRTEFYFTMRTIDAPMLPNVIIEGYDFNAPVEASEWNRMEYIIRILESHVELCKEWHKRSTKS